MCVSVNKPWSCSPLNLSYQPRCCELRCTARPLGVAKAGQRGWAAKHSAQWHMLCGFLGTGWRTVVLLCQASLYCWGPLGCSSPDHSRGWKGISLGSSWKDATLDSANASILYACTVVAELLTVAMAEAGPLSWDKSLHRTTLPLRSSTNHEEVGASHSKTMHDGLSGYKGASSMASSRGAWNSRPDWTELWLLQ